MTMKLCIIGKYPPIQGGVSQENFWQTYALAQSGFDIHMVTNAAEVENEFRCIDLPFLPNPLDSLVTASGKVTVHYTSSRRYEYIPWANPFVTKLAATTTDVIKMYGCELIHSSYFEPYAVAAYLASQWTGVPYGIRHAGSDVGRLFQAHGLQTSYANVVLSADYLLTGPKIFRSFLHLGVESEKLYLPGGSHSLPTDYFNSSVAPLDINRLLAVMAETLPKDEYYAPYHRLASKPFDPSLPTIGIYGKVGEAKGSFDLLAALSKLYFSGVRFNFLALNQGRMATIQRFARRIEESGLEQVSWLLPFIPHWGIPHFLRACTAVCHLERDFPIKIHTPTVPREVLACGTCLVMSHEIANKQIHREQFRHSSNVFLVEPRNIDELARCLEVVVKEPAQSHAIGMKGYEELSAKREHFDAYKSGLVALYTSIQQDVALRRQTMSVAEMQAYLARLYTSDPFRKLFELDPETTLGDYTLDEEEVNALKQIDRKMLNWFAGTLKGKRQKKIAAAYPLLFKVPGINIEKYYNRYYNLYPAKPHEAPSVQILTFGEFMEQSLATDKDAPPYSSDLVRYERLYYMAAFAPTKQDALAVVNQTADRQPQSIGPETFPRLAEGVHFSSFRFHVVKIAEAIQQGQEVNHLQDGTYCFVFQQETRSLKPNIFAISPATKDLLLLCDGSCNVAAIVNEMEKLMAREHLGEQIGKMLQHLETLKVLGV